MKKQKIKIILVDDHKFFRRSIVNLMKRYKQIEIVGEADNGEDYLQRIESFLPDIALMDLKMNKTDGIETTRISTQIHPEIKIIALTFEKGKECIHDLIQAGVKGILQKDASIKEIVTAIIAVHNGENYFAKNSI
ncbi:MAG: response regulator transcription factor [Bacteroidales bacterium]|nr:response regulator transcription factor [Bacteroidales bacterium]